MDGPGSAAAVTSTVRGEIRVGDLRFPIVRSGWTGGVFSVVGRLPGPMEAGGGPAEAYGHDGQLLWWSQDEAHWGPAGAGDTVDVTMTLTFSVAVATAPGPWLGRPQTPR